MGLYLWECKSEWICSRIWTWQSLTCVPESLSNHSGVFECTRFVNMSYPFIPLHQVSISFWGGFLNLCNEALLFLWFLTIHEGCNIYVTWDWQSHIIAPLFSEATKPGRCRMDLSHSWWERVTDQFLRDAQKPANQHNAIWWFPTNVRGELALSCRWTGGVGEITGWRSRLQEMKFTDHFRGICRIYLKLMKKN